MNICEECKYGKFNGFKSGECLRFPPVPVYQKNEFSYGEPIMEVITQYPLVYVDTSACGEFKHKNELGVIRGAALLHGEEVTGL